MGYKLFMLMGKSASGKDSICAALVQRFGAKLRKIVPYTTRPIREGEQNGREYFFVTPEEMEKMRDEGRVLECRTYQVVVGEWHYFTADDGQIDTEGSHSIMIATPEVYFGMMKTKYADAIVPVYIESEDEERLLRSIWRERKQENPNFAEVCRRYLADEKDFAPEILEKMNIRLRFLNWQFSSCVRIVGEAIAREMEKGEAEAKDGGCKSRCV